MIARPVCAEHLRSIATRLLPGIDLTDSTVASGQFHEVLLIPGVAAVRVARRPAAAAELPRRARLLDRLARLGLPFAVPVPISDVTDIDGTRAAAVSWIDGAPLARGVGDSAQLRALLDALHEVDAAAIGEVLDVPHAYAGRERWERVLRDAAIPLLPLDLRAAATARVDAACALEPVPPSLVHGDLGGENLRWDGAGRLSGVLDWDLAAPFDPAVDAACLAWHGGDAIERAVDPLMLDRARVWAAVFGVEQLASAICNAEPPAVLERYVAGSADWLRATRA